MKILVALLWLLTLAPDVASAQPRTEVVLMDGYWKDVVLNRTRLTGSDGSNIDDLYDALQSEPYLLGAEFSHTRWKRYEYLKTRSPKIIIVGLYSFNASNGGSVYAARNLVTHLLSHLAKTKIKFIVYHWGLNPQYELQDIRKHLCAALEMGSPCPNRLRLLDVGKGDPFPSPEFVGQLKGQLSSLAKEKS